MRIVLGSTTLVIEKDDLDKLPALAADSGAFVDGVYMVKSDVSQDAFESFMDKFFGEPDVAVTPENYEDLEKLCNEFGFSGFGDAFKKYHGIENELLRLLSRVAVLETERKHDHRLIETFMTEICELKRSVALLEERIVELERQSTTCEVHEEPVSAVYRRETVKFEDLEGNREFEIPSPPGMTILDAKRELAKRASWAPGNISIIDDVHKELLEDDGEVIDENLVRRRIESLRVAFIDATKELSRAIQRRVEKDLPGQGAFAFKICARDIDVFQRYVAKHRK